MVGTTRRGLVIGANSTRNTPSVKCALTSAWPATARLKRVLPIPGGPTRVSKRTRGCSSRARTAAASVARPMKDVRACGTLLCRSWAARHGAGWVAWPLAGAAVVVRPTVAGAAGGFTGARGDADGARAKVTNASCSSAGTWKMAARLRAICREGRRSPLSIFSSVVEEHAVRSARSSRVTPAACRCCLSQLPKDTGTKSFSKDADLRRTVAVRLSEDEKHPRYARPAA